MNLINLPDIIISPDRVRKEFDEFFIESLACSIYNEGLHHAPVLDFPDASLNTATLIAGENRLRAMKLLSSSGLQFFYDGKLVEIGTCPYTQFRPTDDTTLAYEAELNENLKRKNLTWQEEVAAVSALHVLRIAKHGDAGPHGTQTGWTIKDTADEIAKQRKGRKSKANEANDISQSLIIAKHMDDPFVAASKTPKEAMKVIRETVKHEKRKELKQKFDENKEEDNSINLLDLTESATQAPHSTNAQFELHRGNFFDIAPKLPSSSFDVILTDPPYGIDIHKHTLWDGQKHEYDDSEDYLNKLLPTLAAEAFRVAKPQAHVYVFCDISRWERLFVAFELAGWRVWRRPLIWDKGNTGSFGDASHGPRATYDAILYAIKGERETTAMYRDVIPITQPTIGNHPASKPVELYVDLLRRSVYPGDSVVDFFCGSGPIFPAAKQLDLRATGIELEEKYYLMSVERLSEL